MNSVFFKARSEFDPDEDYDGSTVVSILLDTIKVRNIQKDFPLAYPGSVADLVLFLSI